VSTEFYTICEKLVCATANGVYQGVLVTVLAGLALACFRRTNAATRHAVLLGLLVFVTGLIPAHWVLSALPRREAAASVPRPAGGTPTVAVDAAALASDARVPVADFAESELLSEEPAARETEEASGSLAEQPAPESVSAGPASHDGTRQEGKRLPPWDNISSFYPAQNRNLEKAIHFPGAVCLGLLAVCGLLVGLR